MGNFKRLWKEEKTGLYYDTNSLANLIETDFVYNTETKIVYHKPKNLSKKVEFVFLNPCKSQNGKKCMYMNKKIVEIDY